MAAHVSLPPIPNPHGGFVHYHRLIERAAVAALLVYVVERLSQISPIYPLGAVVWICIVAPLFLTPRALLQRSWLKMWVAALMTFVVSILGMFSIGMFVFALTSVQLGAVVALRHEWPTNRLLLAMLIGLLAWVAIVPLQLVGFRWFLGAGLYQIVGLLGVVLAPVRFSRRRHVAPSLPKA
ncbi:MAG: hypothetical protein U0031_01580 [Thermomicrobiales bacterium]